MSTQPAFPPATPTTINPNDPRLTEEVSILDEWCPVDTSGPIILISDRYAFLKDFTQQLILALWENGHEETARRLATCGIRGSVYKRCKKRIKAKARRHICHCWICEYCGQARNLLRVWLRTRRYEVRTDAQRGLEVTGPVGWPLNGYTSLIGKWLVKRGIDVVSRQDVEARPKVERVRMVLRTDHVPYAELLAYLRRITHEEPGYAIRLHSESSPLAALQWMFASTESVLENCGNTRARLFDRYYRRRLLKTYGEFYSPVKDPRSISVDEDYEDDYPAIASACNCGQCDGIMEHIPWNEQVVESVDRIEDQYPGGVDWTSNYDPFRIKRKQAQVTVNSERVATAVTISEHSPPS